MELPPQPLSEPLAVSMDPLPPPPVITEAPTKESDTQTLPKVSKKT